MNLEVTSTAPPDWDALSGGELFPSRQWLAAMGERFSGRRVYAVGRSGDDRPLVGCFGTVIGDHNAYTPTNLFQVVALGAVGVSPTDQRDASDPSVWFPNLFFSYPGYETYAIGKADHVAEGLADFASLCCDWARGEQLAVVAFTYTGQQLGEHADALRERGFSRATVARRAELLLPQGGFEAYLAALSGTQRKQVRREVRQLSSAGVLARVIPPEPWIEEMTRLRVMHQRKYGHRAVEAEERERISRLVHGWPDKVLVVGAFNRQDRLLAYTVSIRDGARLNALLSGTDYEQSDARLTHFLVGYYWLVEIAEQYGFDRISYGIGSPQAKQQRGCGVEDVHCWLTGLTTGAQSAIELATGRAAAS